MGCAMAGWWGLSATHGLNFRPRHDGDVGEAVIRGRMRQPVRHGRKNHTVNADAQHRADDGALTGRVKKQGRFDLLPRQPVRGQQFSLAGAAGRVDPVCGNLRHA